MIHDPPQLVLWTGGMDCTVTEYIYSGTVLSTWISHVLLLASTRDPAVSARFIRAEAPDL